MNKVILMGRPTEAPQIRATGKANGMAANFTLAVQRPWVKKDAGDDVQKADFIRCSAFNKTAEFCEKYVKKGSRYVVEGRLQSSSYTNKEGQKVYTTEVLIENIEFADSAPNQASPESTAPAGAPTGYGAPPTGAPTGYGIPPAGAPTGYGAAPTGAPAGYGAAPTGAPAGYGTPTGAPAGYGAPTGVPAGYGAAPTGVPAGYGAAPTGTPAGYMAPPAGFTNVEGQEELPFH